MFYYLFVTYGQNALTTGILASLIFLFLLLLFLMTSGSSIRRRAQGKPSRRFAPQIVRVLMLVALTFALTSGYVHFLGDIAIRIGPSAPLKGPLALLVGAPPSVDARRLLGIGLFGTLIVLLANLIVISQSAPGSRLRLWADSFRAISRRQASHGSSHFATPQEYRRFRALSDGGVCLYGKFMGQRIGERFLYLGDRFTLSAEDAARGLLTIGNPGSGKSSSVILPVIYDAMRAGQNLVVADPQHELSKHVVQYARLTGHRVVLHDPTEARSPRFNIASDIRNVSDARAIAEVLVPKAGQGGESFWTQSAEMLLAACLLRFDHLGAIFAAFTDLKKLAATLASQDDDAQRLAGAFLNSVATDGKLATNIIATLSTSLTAWADETVRESTTVSDFTARTLVSARQPTIVILACPGPHRRVLAPYLGAVLTRLLRDLDALGERRGDGTLPVPVKFVIDEFPALGDLSAVVEFANLVRKRRISFLLAAQTLGQLENIYGRSGAETLLAGMAFQIIFGGCDPRTAEFYSQMTGIATRTERDQATGRATTQRRALLTPDEIVRPPQGSATLFGRYVTGEYATYAIVLARLTRIYERQDVREALARSEGGRARVCRRPPPVPVPRRAKPLCRPEALS